MATVNMTIPYNGGTISTHKYDRHTVWLGDQSISVFMQTNPNYLYAYQTSGAIKAASFGAVNGPTTAVLTPATAPVAPTSNVRLYKLSANRAILHAQNTLCVLEIDASKNVALKGATLANFSTFGAAGVNRTSYTYSGTGSFTTGSSSQGWYVKDNVCYFAVRNGTNPCTVSLIKVTYDPAADTLSQQTIVSVPLETTRVNFSVFQRSMLQDIPGSNKKLFSIMAAYNQYDTNGMGSAPIAYAALINADDSLGTVLPLPSSAHVLAPLKEDRIVGISYQGKSFQTWTGTTWSQPAVLAAYAVSGGVVEAIALDDQYFFLIGQALGADPIAGTTSYYDFSQRICRFISPTQGSSASDGTNSPIFGMNSGSLFSDQQIFHRLDADTFYTVGEKYVSAGPALQKIVPEIQAVYKPDAKP